MAPAWDHARSSARKFGGTPEEFAPLHLWLDASKGYIPTWQHRALRHHAEGIRLMTEVFGPVLKLSDGREVATTLIGEQHVREDLGWIPTVQDWLRHLAPVPWMLKGFKLEHDDGKEGDSKTQSSSRTRVGSGAVELGRPIPPGGDGEEDADR